MCCYVVWALMTLALKVLKYAEHAIASVRLLWGLLGKGKTDTAVRFMYMLYQYRRLTTVAQI